VPEDDVRRATAHAYDLIVDEFVRRTDVVNDDLAEFRSAFVAAVGADARVADVGCGPGRDATHFQQHGLRVVGFDASTAMVRRARERGVDAVQADMRALPLGLRVLDGIWSVASLLHVPRVDVPATLAMWRTCLGPAGVLGLGTSLGSDEGWEACPYDPTSQHTRDTVRRWFVHHDETTLLTVVTEAGFDVMSSRIRESNRRWLQVLARRANSA